MAFNNCLDFVVFVIDLVIFVIMLQCRFSRVIYAHPLLKASRKKEIEILLCVL
jgi:hypothetical protein